MSPDRDAYACSSRLLCHDVSVTARCKDSFADLLSEMAALAEDQVELVDRGIRSGAGLGEATGSAPLFVCARPKVPTATLRHYRLLWSLCPRPRCGRHRYPRLSRAQFELPN